MMYRDDIEIRRAFFNLMEMPGRSVHRFDAPTICNAEIIIQAKTGFVFDYVAHRRYRAQGFERSIDKVYR